MEKDRMYDDIVFLDKNFRLKVKPNTVSFLNANRQHTKVFHEEIEIKYFVEGSSVLQIGDEIITARAGDIVVINSYEFHATIEFGEEKGKYHSFIIGLDFFSNVKIGAMDLRKLMFEKQCRFKHLLRGREDLGHILSQIVEESVQQKEQYRIIISGLLLTFFASLLRSEVSIEENGITDVTRMRYYNTIEPALRKIRDCYGQKLTLEELAALCNVSKCYFSRIFKIVTNMTVVQYITEYRFNIADFMLTNSDSSIATIASNCGFENESYFCRYYKKKRGISPYQNRVRLR